MSYKYKLGVHLETCFIGFSDLIFWHFICFVDQLLSMFVPYSKLGIGKTLGYFLFISSISSSSLELGNQ